MNKIALLVSLAVLLICLSLGLMARAQPPTAWRSLQVGDTIWEAKAKVPELMRDSKDGGLNQWYNAIRSVQRLGVTYQWYMDVHFDKQGRLERIDGRSYNKLTGLLDGVIQLPRD